MNRKHFGLIVTITAACIIINCAINMERSDVDKPSLINVQKVVNNKSSVKVTNSFFESQAVFGNSNPDKILKNNIKLANERRLNVLKNSHITYITADEIGGYIDVRALAPEDEIFQNKNTGRIGYDEPNAKSLNFTVNALNENFAPVFIKNDIILTAPENGN